jgi:LuxR family transcriptional regulator, maltose regulon positive regulatory protein
MKIILPDMLEYFSPMHTSLLTTKLFTPPNRPNWVVRPRLLQTLNDSRRQGCRMVMVSAPAGFGKTTLVTGWIDTLKQIPGGAKTSWLSLDASDNDLGVFLSYLIAALRRFAPGIGEITENLLEQTPLPTPEALLLPLVNDLTTLNEQVILVLDDYHLIQLPEIHQALAFIIERQPPNMEIVITTRQDPLLPLSRWRARGLLREIRLKELRFNEGEAAEFLSHAIGFALKAEDVAALETRTEGWIAGLQLAAISLVQSGASPGENEASHFIQTFTGNDRFIMDYLIDEVLSRQAEDVQRFLLHTSVLERFNAGLCQDLLQNDGADPLAILAYLDQANLFLIPLDQKREWYRYHHLFAELLQYRLKNAQGTTLVTELKRRASAWFDRNGYADEALRYAQAAADWEMSACLVEKYGPYYVQRGELAMVMRWLAALPDPAIRQSPFLCRFYGYLLTISGKLDLGEIYLRLAEEALPDDADHQGSTLAFASYNACFRGDFQGEIELARRALALLPKENTWTRGLAAVSLGLGLCHVEDPEGCESAMKEAFLAGQLAQNMRTCVHALTYLGRTSVLHLDFRQAESYFQHASEYKVDGRDYGGSDMAVFDLAQLKYEQNDLEPSLACVQHGLELNQRTGGIEMRAYGYRLAARLHQLRGEREKAREYFARVLRLAEDYNLSPLTLSLNAACQVEMALTDGNYLEARQASTTFVNATGLYTFCFYPELARVHLLLAQGKLREGMNELEPALARAERPGWEYPRLQVRVLQSLGESDAGKARQHLREALLLAEQGGAMRTFIDLGAPLQALLLDLRPMLKPGESAYADRILAVFKAEIGEGGQSAGQKTGGAGQTGNATLLEPLSEREIEVLRLLADGLSNAEIAQRLYLSPNTLKAHTQNIYSKLDVHSRVQVVNKARELGIINSPG